MKRTAIMITSALAIAITMGTFGSEPINAQQPPAKSTVLQRTDIAGIEGKEGVVILAEIFPGAVAPKHYHPGYEFSYVLEGSMILEVEGKPPAAYTAGESYILPPKQVHYAKNGSMNASVKVLSFSIIDKGQPLAVPVK